MRPISSLSLGFDKKSLRELWRAYSIYFAALLILITSRLVIFLAIVFADRFIPQNPSGQFWNATSNWYHFLLRYDSGWYLTIMKHGYSYDGNNLVEHPVAFYPLYPLVTKFFMWVSGLDVNLSAVLVTNIILIVAVPIACKLFKENYGSRVALLTTGFICFFPTSFFFSAGYTESLAFLFAAGCFLALKKERWVLAALCAGLACATRSTGVLLLAPLLWELWRRFKTDYKRLALYTAACSLLATSGLWLYMIYLWKTFNSPLAFVAAGRAWQRGMAIGKGPGLLSEGNLFQALMLKPFRHLEDIFYAGPNPNSLDPWFFLLFFLLIIFGRKRVPFSFTLYALGVLLLPYITISGSLGFQSFTRYILLAFPVFIILAQLSKRRAWLGLGLTGIFAAMLFMYTALFAQWYWAG